MTNIDKIINLAFEEDLDNRGDVTSLALFDENAIGQARFICKSSGILSGLEVARRCFFIYDHTVVFKPLKKDSDFAKEGEVIATVNGKIRSLLAIERTALNFLNHLSGIATYTNVFIQKIKGTQCRLKDTRKTTPGLRELEKMAVKHGGGVNHRFGLYDGILIKDNHLAGQPIKEAIQITREQYPSMPVEVEVETLEQVQEALDAKADILLLDNMDEKMLKQAVAIIGDKAETEASGGINLETIAKIALTGVNYISTSAITMAAPPLDISLDFD